MGLRHAESGVGDELVGDIVLLAGAAFSRVLTAADADQGADA